MVAGIRWVDLHHRRRGQQSAEAKDECVSLLYYSSERQELMWSIVVDIGGGRLEVLYLGMNLSP
jgi:hypothetical protein